jgi:YegS/Rv2252/BmrU family lipid kinase
MPQDTWFFIVNSTAGRGRAGRKITELLDKLNSLNIPFEIEVTKAPRHAIEQARSAIIDKGFRHLVAVGGDGTLNEVINGIMRSGLHHEVKLALFPEGGGNDFAKYFHLSPSIHRDVELLVRREVQPIDVGRINDCYFINSLGIGFDAVVAGHANRIKYINGLPRYTLAVLKALFSLRRYPVEFTLDAVQHHTHMMMLSVGNGRYCGGGYQLTPSAQVDDGKLDICLIKEASLFRLLNIIPKALKGVHIHEPEVEMLRGRELKIRSSLALPIYFDGEIPTDIDRRNITVSVIPHAIQLICNSSALS